MCDEEKATLADVGISIEVLRPLLRAASREDPRDGLPHVDPSRNRISLSSVPDLVRRLLRECGGLPIGFEAASRLAEGDLGVFDLLVGSATTLREAATLASDAFGLLVDSARLELREEGALSSVRLLPSPGHLVPAQLAEFALVATTRISRRLSDRELPATEVFFEHAKPKYARQLEAFFGAPVRFTTGQIALVFPTVYLDVELPRGNADRQAILAACTRRILDHQLDGEGLVTKVWRAIAGGLESNEHRLETVAAKLDFEPRTLQRRLGALKTTYGEVLDAVRRYHALHAAENGLPANEIGRRVGLPDRTTLARAFRRWTGSTPRTYARRASPRGE